MAIESIAAATIAKEAVAAKAAEIAQQQLGQKMAMESVENQQLLQTMEQSNLANNFRIGELSVPEVDKRDVFKEKEQEAIDDLSGKLDENSTLDIEPEKMEPCEVVERELQEFKNNYIDDIVKNSEFPETIDIEKANLADYEKCSPEDTAVKREEFNQNKNELIQQWEKENEKKWPTYDKDVHSSNGYLIRRAGDKYDAHHIQPLSMGGKNEASNLTPLRAECHYDRQGIHSTNSPYERLNQRLGA